MKKDIKDYLHLYFGCDIYFPPREEGAKADIMSISWRTLHYPLPKGSKLILRPLSDMTEEEYIEWMNLRGWVHENFKGKEGAENGIHCGFADGFSAAYLLKHSFDLFGLIESGLAIDKTKINL